jgi:starch synthase
VKNKERPAAATALNAEATGSDRPSPSAPESKRQRAETEPPEVPSEPPKTVKPEPTAQTAEAPKPETKPARPEEPLPLPMPAEAESVHVEEPVPDEPAWEASSAPQGPELFIVHISPEMAPVAKVGGLADVVFGLTGELAIRGNHVEVILPKYDNLRYDHIYEVHEVYNDLWVPWYDGAIHCTVFFGFVHGRKCFFIEPHSGDNFFNRGSVYGFSDDILRFAFFSRAAMEFLWKSGKHPDIIHCHDWQTALVPVLLYEIYQQLGMTHPRACLTIHNFKHQGVTGMEMLRATGLHDPDRYFDYNRLRDNNHQHALNLLKGGIVYSNFITTVSPHYAMETKDQNQGFGLEPTLHTHHMKYGGVLNGIDYNVWNPEVDHLIPVRYGVDDIDGKYADKRALRHRLMLADNEKPIVAFIGRLDPQKGLELVRHAIFQSLERGAQVVLLGSSPDHAINSDFWHLKQMLNDSPDCHLEIGYDEELSHLIYAGADIMLVPSQFEPCGLTQLISLRYGTIPVVRAVGGLADTVFDKDHSNLPLHERNGYVFENYDHEGLDSALIRAIDCYYQYPEHFRDLMRNAMRTDYSWNHPGQDYMNIYDYIRTK